jgi:putative proteasome-type protease
MTYCIAIKVNEGLVFAADTRTSAGVDDVRTYNKLHSITLPDRVFVILSAGNLATTQAVLAALRRDMASAEAPVSLSKVRHMYDAAEYLGQVSVRAQKNATAEGTYQVNVETTFILGGQISGEEPALYLVYPLGNCIAVSPEMPFMQIGEHKYGKPILDRIIRPQTPLEDAARCALVSLDSTMRSNLSVGPPIDLAIVPTDQLGIAHQLRFDLDTPFYAALKDSWGRNLEAIFRNLPRFEWEQQISPQQDLLVEPVAQVSPQPGGTAFSSHRQRQGS